MIKKTIHGVPFSVDTTRRIRYPDGRPTPYGRRVMARAMFAWAWFNAAAPGVPLPAPYSGMMPSAYRVSRVSSW